jgi:outer membrane immunogenic protein
MNAKIDWFGSTRGRIGFLPTSSMLLYFTGGVAYGRVNNSVAGPFLFAGAFTIDRTAVGSSLGGGIEYKFASNLTGRIEYQHIDLGSNVPTTATGVRYNSFPTTFVNRDRFDSIRIGVSYLFGPH